MPIEGWTWREKYGNPVYASKENIKKRKALTREDLMLPGMELFVISLSGYVSATLCKDDFGVFFAETESYYWPMTYDEEDNCFVTLAVINKEAIKIMENKLSIGDRND